jgi:hypothetical protein
MAAISKLPADRTTKRTAKDYAPERQNLTRKTQKNDRWPQKKQEDAKEDEDGGN